LKGGKQSILLPGEHVRAYAEKGIAQGRRPELVGGGLIRSAGGWSLVKAMRRAQDHMKSDERILVGYKSGAGVGAGQTPAHSQSTQFIVLLGGKKAGIQCHRTI
jgi:hypothetical protein